MDAPEAGEGTRELPDRRRPAGLGALAGALGWAWLVVALAAYLYRFRGLLGPILSKLGLA